MDFRALLQNQWFQLCLVVAVISGGTSIFNLAQPGTPRPPPPSGPTPPPGSLPTPIPGQIPTPTPFTKLKPKTAGRWIVDASGAADADSRTLPPVVGSASDGDVITIRPGDYYGGIVVVKSNVRFVGQVSLGGGAQNLIGGGNRQNAVDGGSSGGGATLHAQGMDTILVTAKNVAFENLRIEQDTPGGQAALRVLGESRVNLIGCEVRSKSTYAAVAGGNAAIDARDTLFQNPGGNGSALQFEMNSRGTLTGCTISKSRWGLALFQTTQVKVENSTFQNLGLTNGFGQTMSVEGGRAQLTVNQCRFLTNPAGIFAKEGASLSLTDCVLKDNGITGETGNTTLGLICAQSGAKLTLRGDTFENNKQGVVAQRGSTLVLERVQIRGTGVVTDNQELRNYCNAVAATGQGCTVRIAGSTITDTLYLGIVASGGAQLTMNETTITNTGGGAIWVGSTDGPGKATLNGVKILRAQDACLWVGDGSELEAQNCQLEGAAKAGLRVDGANTRGQITNSTISNNRDLGLSVYNGASFTATGCTIEGNARGALAGFTGGGAKRGAITLENCTVRGNSSFGVGACQDSVLVMRGGNLSGQRQNSYQERGGSVQLSR